MKKDTKETIGGALVTILFIVAIVVMIFKAIDVWSPTDFHKDFKIEEYYVCRGDTAWDIYTSTCSNVDWNEWCDFVRTENNLSSIGDLQVGQMLLIPCK